MVKRLSKGSSYTVGTVSLELGVSRQGARKHLQVLADAGLVFLEQDGRDVKVGLDRKSLDEAREFIARLERQWDKRLEALRDFVEESA
jgi:DNA-binding transcriptional ArsR family regulator